VAYIYLLAIALGTLKLYLIDKLITSDMAKCVACQTALSNEDEDSLCRGCKEAYDKLG